MERRDVKVPAMKPKVGERECESELLKLAKRVPMREGSVLVWNQTLAHGTEPNDSSNCRFAQFLKAFPRSRAFGAAGETRLKRRATALRALLVEAGADGTVSPTGERLFGLDACGE